MNKSKVFFDIEKETKWLNSLAKQGYRLTGKSGFTYRFKPCEKVLTFIKWKKESLLPLMKI